jgi:hypothetical protein
MSGRIKVQKDLYDPSETETNGKVAGTSASEPFHIKKKEEG